jgi:hypothetical protein
MVATRAESGGGARGGMDTPRVSMRSRVGWMAILAPWLQDIAIGAGSAMAPGFSRGPRSHQ